MLDIRINQPRDNQLAVAHMSSPRLPENCLAPCPANMTVITLLLAIRPAVQTVLVLLLLLLLPDT